MWFFLGYTAELVLGLCYSLDSSAQLVLQFCLTFLFFLEFRCFLTLGPLGRLSKPSWGLLAQSWRVLKRSWGILAPLGTILEPFGPLLGASWASLGGLLGYLGPLLAVSLGPLDFS